MCFQIFQAILQQRFFHRVSCSCSVRGRQGRSISCWANCGCAVAAVRGHSGWSKETPSNSSQKTYRLVTNILVEKVGANRSRGSTACASAAFCFEVTALKAQEIYMQELQDRSICWTCGIRTPRCWNCYGGLWPYCFQIPPNPAFLTNASDDLI